MLPSSKLIAAALGLSVSAFVTDASAQACSKDLDCPGEAICEGGQCMLDGKATGAAPAPAPAGSPPTGAAPPPSGAPAPSSNPVLPPPQEDRGAYNHDGFYLDFGLGFTSMTGTSELSTSVAGSEFSTEVEASGAGLASHFFIGGTPIDGLALGGGLVSAQVFSPTIEVDGQELDDSAVSDSSFALAQFGVFATYYFISTEGFHTTLFAGFSRGEACSGSSSSDCSEGTGLGLRADVGYSLWIGEQWSFSPKFGFTYAPLSDEDVDFTVSGFHISAGFTLH